jgi:hypothetical protein
MAASSLARAGRRIGDTASGLPGCGDRARWQASARRHRLSNRDLSRRDSRRGRQRDRSSVPDRTIGGYFGRRLAHRTPCWLGPAAHRAAHRISARQSVWRRASARTCDSRTRSTVAAAGRQSDHRPSDSRPYRALAASQQANRPKRSQNSACNYCSFGTPAEVVHAACSAPALALAERKCWTPGALGARLGRRPTSVSRRLGLGYLSVGATFL